jgi:hypothetical protein
MRDPAAEDTQGHSAGARHARRALAKEDRSSLPPSVCVGGRTFRWCDLAHQGHGQAAIAIQTPSTKKISAKVWGCLARAVNPEQGARDSRQQPRRAAQAFRF